MKKSLFIIALSIFMCGFSSFDKLQQCATEFKNKEFDKAKQTCGEIVKENKNIAFVDMASDFITMMKVDEEEVIKEPKKYLKSPVSQFMAADIFYKKGYYEKTEYLYREVAKYDINKLKKAMSNEEQGKELVEAVNQIVLTAQTKLGIILAASDKKKEIQEGMKWLKKAADQGSIEAFYPLGFYSYLYANNKKEYKEIFNYFFTASKSGNKDALIMLGIMYFTGNGVEENNLVAYNLWATAANAGHVGAKLLVHYEDLESYVKMFTSLKMMTSSDKEHKSTLEYVNWLRDGKTKECLSKKQLSEKEQKEGLTWFFNMADMGLNFAKAYVSLYMLSQGDTKNTIEVLA